MSIISVPAADILEFAVEVDEVDPHLSEPLEGVIAKFAIAVELLEGSRDGAKPDLDRLHVSIRFSLVHHVVSKSWGCFSRGRSIVVSNAAATVIRASVPDFAIAGSDLGLGAATVAGDCLHFHVGVGGPHLRRRIMVTTTTATDSLVEVLRGDPKACGMFHVLTVDGAVMFDGEGRCHVILYSLKGLSYPTNMYNIIHS